MTTQLIKCPECGADAQASGQVNCLCDKDFCMGQRCGADDLSREFSCAKCGAHGVPPDTKHYRNWHIK